MMSRSLRTPNQTPWQFAQSLSSSGILSGHEATLSPNHVQHYSHEAFTPLNCMTVSPIATPRLKSPPATTRIVLRGKSVCEVRWNDIATIDASSTTSSIHIAQVYAYSDPLQMKHKQNEKSMSCKISRPKNELFSVTLLPEYFPSSIKSCYV